LIPPKNPMVNI